MPADMLRTLPGYDPDVHKSRGEARKLMERLGYGSDKRLSLTIGIRDIPFLRDSGIILIDQLKDVYIDGELDPVETSVWFPRIARREYQVELTGITSGVYDPDQQLYENYACGSERNYSGYCDRDTEQLIDRQSREADQEKRRTIFSARSASRLALKKKPAATSTFGGCGCQPSRATASLSKIAQIGPPPLWPSSMPARAAFSQLFGAYSARCTLRQSPCK
jgi:ABC-type oligopeptide transport system substrate-binding subunit